MKDLGRPPNVSAQVRLVRLLRTQFDDAPQAYELFAEFFRHSSFSKSLCLKLLDVAQDRTGTAWDIRRLAVLMLEHQTLKIHPDNLDEFNFLFSQLNLKKSPALNAGIVRSVLKEGYSTTNLRRFVLQFRRRLQRLDRVHAKMRGWKTSDAGLSDFIDLSRQECKLTLARHLFTPEEVVDQILRQVAVSNGAKDLDSSQPLFVETEAEHGISRLPEFEASILKKLCASSRIYWVSEATPSQINSLVEYPLTTVALVIKPPGSHVEFEFKRAGKRGPFSLNVVNARNGCDVAPSHRLDGGNMLWLLRHEAKAAARLGLIYRLVHRTEAPIPSYVSRSTIYSIPAGSGQVQTLTYFTEPGVFGESFHEMRQAMAAVVASFKAEGYIKMPDLPGDLGLTAQFISIVSPGQAILNGTSSFRLDRLAAYLSSDGARRYFERGLNVACSTHAARRLADAILEEVLGVYHAPDLRCQSHKQYVAAAFAVPQNRAQADSVYESILEEIGKMWGTLIGVKGYSRGESFVARNVGLRSVWDGGQWRVKIIFMDHDSVVIPGFKERDFCAPEALPGMILDETYLWGRGSILGTVGHLREIYRISDELHEQARVLARIAMKKAYQKTQHELSRNPKLRALFDPVFVNRVLEWNKVVKGSLRQKPDTAASSKWKDKKRETLAAKAYEEHEINEYMDAIETNRAFLERQSFLFDLKVRQ
ncbi:MAG: hypothetical protein M3R52_07915 [Acidobacteriota bacterium]|nr:hypothetical protein [Acidobacteriota bacterium]